MKLENIIPWGRSKKEYMEMFDLSKEDVLTKKILGCGDGPSSFNTEVDYDDGTVVSIDPLYAYSKKEIMQRIDEVAEDVMAQVKANAGNFVWKNIPDVESLEHIRIEAMMEFLMDYEDGKEEGRYIAAELPNLPFENDSFDLALSSHFLFLYSDHLDESFHKDAVREMLRVSKEVRIFPLLTLTNERSPYVESIVDMLEADGYKVEIVKTGYEFQKGADEMMKITRRSC
ncbi:SAM-dependent methyltransferase [Sulfurovum lithotrophicum]|uniref:SAM-dependent methyltransferase n=1 Tax=Sulfurovum lithotrophicum TaxID=206403 RepID=A0A7U4M1T2_9BACT|nr:class I SAM-dependent methyltransferase [Sulfurovum lithotrophicum]AKF25144.1 SAM-dependent methyltransferase [Sulfurovum lithotrophicum]